MSTGKEDWLRRYLDGDLSEEEERQALHQIADDREMRSLLKFDLLLRQYLASDFRIGQNDDPAADTASASETASASTEQREEFEVPDAFFDGVMNAISQKDDANAGSVDQSPAGADAHESAPSGRRKDSPTLWDRLLQPQPIMLRPVWSAAVAATLLALVVASPFIVTTMEEPDAPADIPVRQIVEKTTDRVMMRFVYVDSDAESVSVAGDFSDWEPISLNQQSINGDIAWTGIIPLPRGEHRYMFIKDGEQWTTDPLANRFVDDGFGNKNAVVNL